MAVGDGWACVGVREGRILVWEYGPGGPPVLRHTLGGHTGWVRAVAVWGGRLVSGSSDKTVRRGQRREREDSDRWRGLGWMAAWPGRAR